MTVEFEQYMQSGFGAFFKDAHDPKKKAQETLMGRNVLRPYTVDEAYAALNSAQFGMAQTAKSGVGMFGIFSGSSATTDRAPSVEPSKPGSKGPGKS